MGRCGKVGGRRMQAVGHGVSTRLGAPWLLETVGPTCAGSARRMQTGGGARRGRGAARRGRGCALPRPAFISSLPARGHEPPRLPAPKPRAEASRKIPAPRVRGSALGGGCPPLPAPSARPGPLERPHRPAVLTEAAAGKAGGGARGAGRAGGWPGGGGRGGRGQGAPARPGEAAAAAQIAASRPPAPAARPGGRGRGASRGGLGLEGLSPASRRAGAGSAVSPAAHSWRRPKASGRPGPRCTFGPFCRSRSGSLGTLGP